jgi:hypothetical protein
MNEAKDRRWERVPLSIETFAATWVVEQMPGGSVTARDGSILIKDAAGCTVWLRRKLAAPVSIAYEAKVSGSPRVSDMNCFWMAADPQRPADLFHAGRKRDGGFSSYDGLRTYYVGHGGNDNTTTRFRRYDGTGARPLLPEHDLRDPGYLLVPDMTYRILLEARDGHARYFSNGELYFDFADPRPLTEGWFGFRTVLSMIEIRSLKIAF